MSAVLLLRAAYETLYISVPTVLDSWRSEAKREDCNARLASWSRRLLEQAQIRLTVVGREHRESPEPFVVMSNHQSLYDIPVLYQVLDRPLRMVAKKELFNIPVFGQALHASEFVEIDRGNRRRAVASLEAAKTAVRGGLDIWVAPEGTRSSTGALGEFKRGGFHLAMGCGARILPVTLDGTRQVMPSRSLRICRGVAVRVTIGEPIDPHEFGRKRVGELVERVRSAIGAPLSA